MRVRFTFISLLLLILVMVGYFLSYMGGFLQFDASQATRSVRFWEDPAAPSVTPAISRPVER